MGQKWQVHKFGGTSVGSAARYKEVAKIIKELQTEGAPLAVVVSAMKGATDQLIDVTRLAQKRDDSYIPKLESLKKWHLDTIKELLQPQNQKAMADVIESDFQKLGEILRGLKLSGVISESNVELVSGYGEIWSAQLLNSHLQELGHQSQWLDAREVLIIESHPQTVTIDWLKSRELNSKWFEKNKTSLVIVTGFVASTKEGVATTLKRNGSDYSASIFGSLLKASEIFIWTDVDGVYSADPRMVPDAVILDELSYNEAAELAYFGAKVVHPSTMGPALQDQIPIWIRNTFNPKFPGTKIHAHSKSKFNVKGFSAINDMALVNLEGTGMVGIPGVAERLFSSMSRHGISVVLISQAGSEHSICFAVSTAQAQAAKKAAENTFFAEIQQGQIENVEVVYDCAIMAIVGDQMAQSPGISGRFFKALGQSGINIRAIAQGSSERNISAVINQKDAPKALRAVHSAFFLSDQTLSVGIIGSGLIGKTFLTQLNERLEQLKKTRKIDVRVRAIANSTKMILDDRQIDLGRWESQLREKGEAVSLKKLMSHLQTGELPHSVVIDATASEDVPKEYPQWLAQGFNVITPNKKANTLTQKFYDELKDLTRKNQKYFIYSTNVGAGLPIIQTLRDLIQTGDKILSIEGIFSGTLSYIFNNLNEKTPFSEVVKKAKDLGYTEPDPRDDLSGTDVARKLLILAREMGIKTELSQIDVESLIPAPLKNSDVTTFMERLKEFDSQMQKQVEKSEKQNQVLRYVGSLDSAGKLSVKLKTYGKDHPFAGTKGSDNIVAFRTHRYDKQPLYIQGPGAGPEVTAAGVFADLLRLAAYLGAPF